MLTALLAIGTIAQSQDLPPRPWKTRAEFAFRASQIDYWTGLPKAQVLALLGPPDDVWRFEEAVLHSGFYSEYLPLITEVWRYGSVDHYGPATLGEIKFRGEVGHPGRLTPGGEHLKDLPSEQIVRELLTLMDSDPLHPLHSVRVVNKLYQLGEKPAIAVLKEKCGNPGGCVRYLAGLYGHPQHQELSYYSSRVVGGVPLFEVWGLGGGGGKWDHILPLFQSHGKFRTTAWRLPDDIESLQEIARDESRDALLRIRYLMPALADTLFEWDGQLGQGTFNALKSQLADRRTRFNAQEARYEFADGSFLRRPQAQKKIWTFVDTGENGPNSIVTVCTRGNGLEFILTSLMKSKEIATATFSLDFGDRKEHFQLSDKEGAEKYSIDGLTMPLRSYDLNRQNPTIHLLFKSAGKVLFNGTVTLRDVPRENQPLTQRELVNPYQPEPSQ